MPTRPKSPVPCAAAASAPRLPPAMAVACAIVLLAMPAFAAKPYQEGEGGSSSQPGPGDFGVELPGGGQTVEPLFVTGRVTSLRLQKLGNPLVYFSLDDPRGCTAHPEVYFFDGNDPDYAYALKALVASRLSGREVKLEGMKGCPGPPVGIDASAVHIIESSPEAGPVAAPADGLFGEVTNLMIKEGSVYFRLSACSGSAPYFTFAAADLPGGFALLLAAQSATRPVRVETTIGSTSTCPAAGRGDVELLGGSLWLL